ncbi:MAG: PaaI family thioesterase [Burkholderiaceae bacterium]|nr:PaaI family thioesterase [Burkholderiaceae bacterium]
MTTASPGVESPHDGRARRIPFLQTIGAQLTREAAGVAVVQLDLRPDLLNNHGGGHGGVVMSLLDSAMANAALSKIDYRREVVTIDMHIAFMKPATGRLTATGRAMGGGRKVCFCEAEIVDEAGEVTARSMGTFRYRVPGPSLAGE